MNKIRNKGVSFVELVIGVVIFGLLIGPIVAQLIQAMKTSEKSKVAQTQYELAENLMENVKNAGSYFYTDNVVNDPYLNQISEGTSGNKVSKYPAVGMEKMTTAGGSEYNGYVLTGETLIGKKKTPYYYAIHVNSKLYADKEDTDATYKTEGLNPNNMELTAVESLDSSKVALISGTIGNYDLTVTNAFMSKKLDILKVGDKTRWEQYTKQQAEIVAFPNDTATRVIEISISDKVESGIKKYTVTCKLRYKDNSTVILKDGIYAGQSLGSYLSPIEYVPYEQTFDNELPNIYLMYNPCLYNSNYMDTDYILLDTSALSDEPEVNLFVIETAEQYSERSVEVMLDMYKKAYKEENNAEPSAAQLEAVKKKYEEIYLINNDAVKERANVKVNIMAKGTSGSGADDFVTVYHNFHLAENGEQGRNKKTLVTNINASSSVDLTMTSGFGFVSADKILPISKSESAVSPLYDVDIYMSETPFSSTSYSEFVSELAGKRAILSGSKGGN